MLKLLILLMTGISLLGCNQIEEGKKNPFEEAPLPSMLAEAVFQSVDTNSVDGQVTFKTDGKGLRITSTIKNTKPGKYGLYLHKIGSCRNKGKAAGPMLDYQGVELIDDHVPGDLGYLDVDYEGNAKLFKLDTLLALRGKKSILGRSVVLRKLDPDKNANTSVVKNAPVVGCGIIGLLGDTKWMNQQKES